MKLLSVVKASYECNAGKLNVVHVTAAGLMLSSDAKLLCSMPVPTSSDKAPLHPLGCILKGEGLSAALACIQLLHRNTADGADCKWSAASNVIAGVAAFQLSMLQHTLHCKSRFQILQPSIQLANVLSYVPWCFVQHPAALLPLQCCP